jgi:hypothetical protein
MTFDQALKASYDSGGHLGARCTENPDLGCIRWSEFMGWIWVDPMQRVSLPAPKLLFADWEMVECAKD